MNLETGIILGVAIVSISGALMSAFIVWLGREHESDKKVLPQN